MSTIPEDRRRVWSVGEVLEGLGSRGASLFADSGWCALGWGRESQGTDEGRGAAAARERGCGERAGTVRVGRGYLLFLVGGHRLCLGLMS